MRMLLCLALLLSSPAAMAACDASPNAANWCFDGNGPIGATSGANDRLGTSLATGDFNGDGFVDLVIGKPGGDGAVIFLPGSAKFPNGTNSDFGQNVGGSFEISPPPSQTPFTTALGFGTSLAVLRAEPFDDLAVGAPGADTPHEFGDGCGNFVPYVPCNDAGLVAYVRGGETGLTIPGGLSSGLPGNRIDYLTPNNCGVNPGDNSLYGSTLAESNGTLLIGAPGVGLNLDEDAGYVVPVGNPFSANTCSSVYRPTLFGDFNRTAHIGASLVAIRRPSANGGTVAYGAPDADNGSITETGAAIVELGGGARAVFSQAASFPPAGNGQKDHFGAAVAAGDFDGDGDDDLVFSAPDKDASSAADSGRLYLLRNDAAGFVPDGIFQQDSVAGQTAEAGDRFGAALAAGYINADKYEDLVVGVPGEDCCGDPADEGFVAVIFGSATGLTTAGFFQFRESDLGGVAVAGGQFGEVLHVADIDRDGLDDIVIGAPHHEVNSDNNAGMVYIRRSTGSTGLDMALNATGVDNTPQTVVPYNDTSRSDTITVDFVNGPLEHSEEVLIDVVITGGHGGGGSSGNLGKWDCFDSVFDAPTFTTAFTCRMSAAQLFLGQSSAQLVVAYNIDLAMPSTVVTRSYVVRADAADSAPANDGKMLTTYYEDVLFADGFE